MTSFFPRLRPALLMVLVFALPQIAAAQAARKATPTDPTEDALMTSAGFLAAHPDLRYRLHGLDEYRQGNHRDAFRFFQRAAYYADKPSQGMIAEMLWQGQGVARDRALAYAWMDLAAERGYRGFLGLRERYWSGLDEDERARAVSEGQELYARYGDAAAQPRIAAVLRRERRRATGSRVGAVGNVQIYIPGPGGMKRIDGSTFYDPQYWDPEQYQAWHDSIWMTPRIGTVSVGDPEQVQPGQAPQRIPRPEPRIDAEEPETPLRDEGGLGTSPVDPRR